MRNSYLFVIFLTVSLCSCSFHGDGEYERKDYGLPFIPFLFVDKSVKFPEFRFMNNGSHTYKFKNMCSSNNDVHLSLIMTSHPPRVWLKDEGEVYVEVKKSNGDILIKEDIKRGGSVCLNSTSQFISDVTAG